MIVLCPVYGYLSRALKSFTIRARNGFRCMYRTSSFRQASSSHKIDCLPCLAKRSVDPAHRGPMKCLPNRIRRPFNRGNANFIGVKSNDIFIGAICFYGNEFKEKCFRQKLFNRGTCFEINVRDGNVFYYVKSHTEAKFINIYFSKMVSL